MSRLVRVLLATATLVTITTTGARDGRPTAAAAAADDAYHPLAPTRILDTREGLGAEQAPVAGGASIDVTVTGVGGVPASGVGAVVLNITGTEPTAPTFVSAYPTGGQQEGSNLNLLPGQTDSNLVVAAVGTDGKVGLYNGFGSTHLVADVAGWFPTGGSYEPLAPARVLDTRVGVGAPPAAVGPGAAIDLVVAGAGGVPADGIGAVVLNITGTEPTAPTFVSAYPTGGQQEGSNLNLLPGQTDSNLVVAAVGTDGKVGLYNGFGSTHLVADVAGWFPTGSSYGALSPARVLDTREGLGAPPAAVSGGATIDLDVTGVGGVPADGVGAVVLNITGTNPTAATFVSAYPAGGQREGSNLNLLPGQTDSNLVIAAVGTGGNVTLYNAFGTTDLIADVAGWFPGEPGTPPTPPPGPPGDVTGTLWVANPQPPTVSSCLFGVDAEAGTRTEDLYCIDLVGVTNRYDTGHYFEISQPRQEFYALEEYQDDDGNDTIWLAIRPLADPAEPRAVIQVPYAVGFEAYTRPNREFAMSPDGNYVFDAFSIFDYSEDNELLRQESVVALIDVEAGTWTAIAEGEYLYRPKWSADGDIIAERWADPVTDDTSTLVRIDGDALIGGTLDYEPIGTSPGRLLALSNTGDQAALAVKGGACTDAEDDYAELYVWDLADGAAAHHIATADSEWECPGYEYGGVTAAAFSPDDSLIAFSAQTFFYCGVSGCYYPRDVHVVVNHRASGPVRIARTGDPAYQVPYEDDLGEQNVQDRGNGVWWTT